MMNGHWHKYRARRLCRIALYYAWHLWSSFRGLLLQLGLKMVMRLGYSRHQNIIIVNGNRATCSSKVFFKRTSAAIDLIMIADPRRFRLVQNQIKIIVNGRLPVKASYHRYGCLCTVDMAKWPFEKNPEWSAKDYACTLIHEATHGRFCQNRIPCIKQTRVRVENACVVESMRFAKKWIGDSFDWHKYLKDEIL